MLEVKYKIAAGTNMGLVRKNNEDNFVVCPDLKKADWRIPQAGSPYTDLGEFGALLVVADGMGGANAGEVASAITVETIQQSFTPERLGEVVTSDQSIQEFMKEVVRAADARIFKRSKEDRSTRGMGTTVVMAWVLGDKAFVCWCGDSRCYMLNRRRGLMQLSKDHSYVQELVDRGELEAEFASDHPLSNVITRCLGDSENRAVPDTKIFQLHDGDTLLLCSDGLSGMCNDIQILDLLIKYRDDLVECKNELISAALNEGGHDNVTVALCNIEMPGNEEQPDDSDESLPKGLKLSDNANSQTPTIRNSQNARRPTVYATRRKNNNYIWLIGGFFVVMLLTFLLVRCFSNNETDTSSTEQQSEKVMKDSAAMEQTEPAIESNQILEPAQDDIEEIIFKEPDNEEMSQKPANEEIVRDPVSHSDTEQATTHDSKQNDSF